MGKKAGGRLPKCKQNGRMDRDSRRFQAQNAAKRLGNAAESTLK
jgi:hypothetical protein